LIYTIKKTPPHFSHWAHGALQVQGWKPLEVERRRECHVLGFCRLTIQIQMFAGNKDKRGNARDSRTNRLVAERYAISGIEEALSARGRC